MNKLYFCVLGIAIVFGAYVCGANIADSRCRMDFANQNLNQLQNFQNQIMKNKRQTDEIVFKTNVRDIRRVLRDKYSIAD